MRPGAVEGRRSRFPQLAIAAPLQVRDFRLLWSGLVVSLLGDGIFFVAVAWEAYAISNRPSALVGVGLAASLPQLALLLVGGAVSDRAPRRRVLVMADIARAVAVGVLAVCGWAGSLRLWELWVVAFVIGAATAFAAPAFDSIVPELVPGHFLQQANGLDQFLRPATLRLLGPALGGLLVGLGGAPGAFAADAATFAFSAWCVSHIAASHVPCRSPLLGAPGREATSLGQDLRQGLRYVRGQVWLWGTFLAATFTYLLFLGPTEVLIPYLVKNQFHGSASSLGVVLGIGGVGSLLAAAVVGQRRHVGRPITFMYAAWAGATLLVAGYGVATRQWQLGAIAFVAGALEAAGAVVWATLKQRLVPMLLLGRVSSIEWFVTTALLPLSYALTPAAVAVLGVRATFVWAGTLGAAVTGACLFIPGMRDHDHAEAGAACLARGREFATPRGAAVVPEEIPRPGAPWPSGAGESPRADPCSS